MKWGEVTHILHGCTVSVSAKSTPKNPEEGEGPYVGVVICPEPGRFPYLRSGYMVQHFADWWDVQLVKGGAGWDGHTTNEPATETPERATDFSSSAVTSS